MTETTPRAGERLGETAFQAAADDVQLDVEAIRQQVEAVLGEALYWFPVRHHSPTVARLLEQTIRQRRPKLLFLEAPACAEALIPHLCASETQPPVAIYTAYCDDDNHLGLAGIASPAEDIPVRYASWYPLLAYSPEYVAIRTATALGCQIRFIDLPDYAQLTPADDGTDDDGAPPPSGPIEREDQRLLVENDFYHALAASAGYQTWTDAWDSLFEFGSWAGDAERFRRELATFCCAARASSSPERLRQDGTLDREGHMLSRIQQTLASSGIAPEQAMVVCGGFHLFLDRSHTAYPEPPPGSVTVSLVPYSFFHVSELSGYAAGNAAPQFYQCYWDLGPRGDADTLLTQHTVSVLKRARKLGESVSPADAIAVVQHARLLAGLRQRPTAILSDLHDALISCCCKGDPALDGIPLQRAMDLEDIGRKVGRIAPSAGQLPIVRDYHACLDQLGLSELMAEEKPVRLTLDTRDERDFRRSAFLHRLAYLKIPAATCRSKPDDGFGEAALFQERWQLKWSPEIATRLIEENLYGDTVENAAMARLLEAAATDRLNAAATCNALYGALSMALPEMVQQLAERCSQAIATDSRVISLAEALRVLLLIDKVAQFRGQRRDVVGSLIHQAYDRACFAIPGAMQLPDGQHPALLQALNTLAEAVFTDEQNSLDMALFSLHVGEAAAACEIPQLRGAFYGLLAELKALSPEAVLQIVSGYALASEAVLIEAGDFLQGMLAVSRSAILLGGTALVDAIDALLTRAGDDAFLAMLPSLRAAFDGLNKRSVSALAQRVAEKHGLADAEQLLTLNTSVAAAAVIARIDAQVEAIMAQWRF